MVTLLFFNNQLYFLPFVIQTFHLKKLCLENKKLVYTFFLFRAFKLFRPFTFISDYTYTTFLNISEYVFPPPPPPPHFLPSLPSHRTYFERMCSNSTPPQGAPQYREGCDPFSLYFMDTCGFQIQGRMSPGQNIVNTNLYCAHPTNNETK